MSLMMMLMKSLAEHQSPAQSTGPPVLVLSVRLVVVVVRSPVRLVVVVVVRSPVVEVEVPVVGSPGSAWA